MTKFIFLLFALTSWAQDPAERQILNLRQQMEGAHAAALPLLGAPLPVRVLPALPKGIVPVAPLAQPQAPWPVPAPEEKVPNDKEHEQALDDIASAVEFIEQYFPGKITHKQLRDGALRGMLSSLDPYSELFTPEENKRLQENLEGSFGGIGIIHEKKSNAPFVVRLLIPNSPALKAGLLPGDWIVKIDGQDTLAMSSEEFVKRARGVEGTKVALTVVSQNGAARAPPRLVEITRAKVEMPNLYSEVLGSGVGYIYLTEFNRHSAEKFNKALEGLQGRKLKALIIDLRDNPGGVMDEVLDIVYNFLNKGDLAVRKRTTVEDKDFKAPRNGDYRHLKVTVLINGRSASGSEILAGSLQDLKKAVLVGTPSFGKGLIQVVAPDIPEPGYAIKMTIGQYYLPTNRSIQRDQDGKGGLIPDILVEVAPEVEAKLAEDRFFRRNNRAPENPARDVALEKAIEHLKSQIESKR